MSEPARQLEQPAVNPPTAPPAPSTEAPAIEPSSAPPPAAVPVAPTAADEDAGSTIGNDDDARSTESLTSSIYDYREIRGRKFHREIGNASYWAPIDESHNRSLDILHHLFTLLFDGKLFKAPVDSPKSALDIGTGTGIWAIEFADDHPECEVVGTDISAIQPNWSPPNLKFEIEDCTQEWTFKSSHFDFIHIRYLGGCIQDWNAFFREAYRCTSPGGYLESHEASPIVYADNGTLPEDSATAKWGPLFIKGGKKLGRSFEVVDDGTQKKAMEAAGFVDIQEHWIKVPVGGWAADPKMKEIGNFAEFAVMSDVESFILFFTGILGWSREEVHVYIARLRKELKSQKHHVYYWQKIVYGRKPETA